MTMNSQVRTLDLILNSCLSNMGPSKGCPRSGEAVSLSETYFWAQERPQQKCSKLAEVPAACLAPLIPATAHCLQAKTQPTSSAAPFSLLWPLATSRPTQVLRAPGRVFGRCLTTPSPPSDLLPL